LAAKRLEMLKEIAPHTSRVAMLWNDTNPSMTLRAREPQEAATKLGVTIGETGRRVCPVTVPVRTIAMWLR
jgi:hypothetical protein